METLKKVEHGTGHAIWYDGCNCIVCTKKKEAIQRLVDSFSYISSDWMQKIAGDIALPMWGTLFIPKDSADQHMIGELLKDIEVPKDNAGNEYEDSEEMTFKTYGWQEVGKTGIYAIEIDDVLVLGIHGAGYSFLAKHWSKLYDELGYRWHE